MWCENYLLEFPNCEVNLFFFFIPSACLPLDVKKKSKIEGKLFLHYV